MGERKRGETEERTVGDQLSFVRMYMFMHTLELTTELRWFWLTDL